MSGHEVGNTEIVQVVVHGALFPRLVEWLEREDFLVVEFSREDPESMRTFGVALGPGRAALLLNPEGP